MKHTISSLCILGIVCVIASCGPKDRNVPIIRKEFKAYIQKSFDDPKDLKEIVEISPRDTISYSSVKALAVLTDSTISQTRELYHVRDSLQLNKLQELFDDIKRSRSISYSDAYKGQLMMVEFMSTVNKEIDTQKKVAYLQRTLCQLRDSLAYRPALYSYEIKYRRQYPGGLKLETAYAYVDSLSGFKAVLPIISDSEMMDPDYNAVFEQSKNCLLAVSELEELYKQRDAHLEEFEKFVMIIK